MQEKVTKKAEFQLNDLLAAGITIVVVGLVLAVGLQITGEVQDDLGVTTCTDNGPAGYLCYNTTANSCANCSDLGHTSSGGLSSAFNASGDAITGTAKIPEKLSIIATVIVAAVIIGLLIRAFAFRS